MVVIQIANCRMGHQKGAKDVPKERIQSMLDLNTLGVKRKAIVQYFGMPQSTVSNILRKSRASDGNNGPKKRGRKQILSPRSIRNLLKYAKKNRFKSLHTITNEFNESRAETVSMSTVRRVLHKNGIQRYATVTKPFLSIRNVKARIQWARRHESYTEEQWDTLIFSDETYVTQRPKTQRKKV